MGRGLGAGHGRFPARFRRSRFARDGLPEFPRVVARVWRLRPSERHIGGVSDVADSVKNYKKKFFFGPAPAIL